MVKAADFFTGPLMTDLADEELVTAVELPLWPTHTGWGIEEFCQRHRDFAVVGVLVALTIDPHLGTVTNGRIALMGVGATAVSCLSGGGVTGGAGGYR